MSDQPAISACVITLNEADRIEACLRSLAWCDEVVVVDSHSTDDDARARRGVGGARHRARLAGLRGAEGVRRARRGPRLGAGASTPTSASPTRLRDEIATRRAGGLGERCRLLGAALQPVPRPLDPPRHLVSRIARCGSSTAAAAASNRRRPTICTSASCSTARRRPCGRAPARPVSLDQRASADHRPLHDDHGRGPERARPARRRGRPRPASRLALRPVLRAQGRLPRRLARPAARLPRGALRARAPSTPSCWRSGAPPPATRPTRDGA